MDRGLCSRWWEKQGPLWGLPYEDTNPIWGLHLHGLRTPKGPASITNSASPLFFTVLHHKPRVQALTLPPRGPKTSSWCFRSRCASPALGKSSHGSALRVGRRGNRAIRYNGAPRSAVCTKARPAPQHQQTLISPPALVNVLL